MKIIEYVDRINLLHKLIKEKKTGTPDNLAKRMRLSKSRICRLIEELKIKGVPIAYSRSLQTYYYTISYKMYANLEFHPLDPDEGQLINGGCIEIKSEVFDAFFVY